MSDARLKIGDVVTLKSGGPKMVIGRIDDAGAGCFWFGDPDSLPRHAPFPIATLKLVRTFPSKKKA